MFFLERQIIFGRSDVDLVLKVATMSVPRFRLIGSCALLAACTCLATVAIAYRSALRPFAPKNSTNHWTILETPAGRVVVQHFRPVHRPHDDPSEFLEGDPLTPDDNGEVYVDGDSDWCRAAGSHPNTFNCCSFAVGDFIGLSPNDWLDGAANEITGPVSPMQVVLDGSFELVAAYSGSDAVTTLARDDRLLPNDVITFVRTGPPIEHVHAGKLIKSDKGENWIVSKFGPGPLLKTNLQAITRAWPDFHEIRVYRFRGKSASKFS